MKSKKILYNNTIYCLDIETTTFAFDKENKCYYYDKEKNLYINGKNELANKEVFYKCSFMYSFCISSINFYTGKWQEEYKGRTYKDLDIILNHITKISINTSLIYVHNLSYELSFFINNLDFFKQIDFSNQIDDINATTQFLFLEKNKPLFIRHNNIEFRCSALLTGMSVKTLGSAINLEKLEYDYENVRTPLTSMTNEEWCYNMRDTEIVLKYLYQKIFSLNEYIKTMSDIPLTRTAITRLNMKANKNINKEVTYTNKNGKKVKTNLYSLWLYECEKYKANSLEQVKFWNNQLFEGAVVYSSPFKTSIILNKIMSADLCSDYPYQMDVRYFPKNFIEVKNRKTYEFIHITKDLKIEDLVKPKISNIYFNAIIKIKNVKARYKFYPFSISKILNISDFRNMYNIEYINGKLIEVKETIEIPITIITYLKLKGFYDFELVDVTYLETTKTLEKSHQYMKNAVIYLAKQKSELKGIVKMIEKTEKYKKYIEKDISDNTIRTLINNCTNYTEQLDTINDLYLLSKGDLNAQYGNNAQHLLREIVLYNSNEKEYFKINDDKSYFENKQKTSYIYGLYIPQYAQATILYISYKFLQKNILPLYIDTDSIKVEYSETAKQVIEDYNNIVKSYENETTKLYGFGLLEIEFIADKFISLGSKTYLIYKEKIKDDEQHIKATISGLPNATKIYNEILEQFNGNFEKLVRKCYHYGVIFDKTICTKLSSIYKYIDCNVEYEDYKEHLTSGTVLEKCECTMKDFINNNTWYAYKTILIKKFNIPFSHFSKVKVSKKEVIENGKKINKYFFKEEVKNGK